MGKNNRLIDSISKLLTRTIWLLVLLVVLAAVGRYFYMRDITKNEVITPSVKPIVEAIPWNEVDQEIATAIINTRTSTEFFAAQQIDEWLANLMDRVDNDFLNWYFSYWTQQLLGIEGLYQYGVHYFFESQPTAAEKLTEEIQEEFSKRVLRPQIAELELKRIVRDTANHYVVQLRKNLDTVPSKYTIPPAKWDRHIEGIAITTYGTDGNRETPVTLKALTAAGAGGTVLLASKMNLLISKMSSKVMALSAGKAASKMAAKTGGKVAAKAGGKFLGATVGVGVLVWDVWDHNKTKKENRPILRQSIEDYFKELKDILLKDPEVGMMVTFNDLEKQIFDSLRKQSGNKKK